MGHSLSDDSSNIGVRVRYLGAFNFHASFLLIDSVTKLLNSNGKSRPPQVSHTLIYHPDRYIVVQVTV